jgi:hypothetical protein
MYIWHQILLAVVIQRMKVKVSKSKHTSAERFTAGQVRDKEMLALTIMRGAGLQLGAAA